MKTATTIQILKATVGNPTTRKLAYAGDYFAPDPGYDNKEVYEKAIEKWR